ncbi:hypothetical protein FA13DRAFT_1729989 [Coprinellus micaceus]|uniref:Uncharacterized protein n=1 Tax=Coprinellus micaceus TaxID=71717 RepID=A0A4Y7TJJ1_COPMI|nr:hypothetical protein FA13DRAFT_1729989 [Coprinellus micaceus]
MSNMGWEIDPNATETVKVRGSGLGMWFSRKKSDDKSSTTEAGSSTPTSTPATTSTDRPRPKRSNTLRWTSKPLVEEPIEEIETEAVARTRPKPTRSRTLAVNESSSSFWSRKDTKDDAASVAPKSDKKEEKQLPARPSHQKAKSETMVATRPRSESRSEVSRSHTTDEHNSGEVAKAPVWLLNAVNALDFLTGEHPKAVSVLSAILITVGSIPAIPAISAGAGGAILASGAAHAIGAVAVGLGQALGAAAAKNQVQQNNNEGSSHH